MTGRRRDMWQRYVADLYRAPECSIEREIADKVSGIRKRPEILTYLDSVMRFYPENHRRHEIACELRHLITGPST